MKKIEKGVCLKVLWARCCHELNLINHLPTLGAVLKCMPQRRYNFVSFMFEPLDCNRVNQSQGINIKLLKPSGYFMYHQL
jgi:hypothetical protein